LEAGAEVVVLDNFSRGKTRLDGAEYIYGDAGDEGTCRDAFMGADAVFNLAAEVAGVEFNQRHHSFMFERNLRLQATPLRIAAEYGINRFLQTSSVCVYPTTHNAPCIDDNAFVAPPTPANEGYSLAKRLGEKLATWHAQESGLHTVIVRPSNIYGPRDYFDERAHVIPALIRKALDDDEILVNGTGQEVREFIYVTDVARGMMAALQRGKPGEAYNLGTNGDTAISIMALAEMIRAHTGNLNKRIVYEQMFDGGDNERWSNATKANEELGWRHIVYMAYGIRETLKWYRAVRDDQ
jgi:GDP-L-fucose synthase